MVARIMPAALDVDREQVRMLVQQMGVREAARRMGLNEETVSAWSARYKWLADLPRSIPLPRSMVKDASIASTAPQVAVNYLKDILLKTRTNHAKVALAVSENMAEWVEETPHVMRDKDNAQALLANAKHAALAGGWQDQAATPKVNLSVTGINARTIEAEVIQDTDLSTETPASTDLADY